MLKLWSRIWDSEPSISHSKIQLTDVAEITYQMVALYHKSWNEIIDAINQLHSEAPCRMKPLGTEGVHIYLKTDVEYHVYPGRQHWVHVIYVCRGVPMCYEAKCPQLCEWFLRHS